eukprot:TRINITY_DN719_c0_g2_i1.p1 TRINITY_DN719_c0_g2~~TRINITY_DN719_c0_g2_i1.p1  ORF type:complete len:554 (+),score=244.36 TRINITY_DN719_c0_g2_i1:149-1810(+)
MKINLYLISFLFFFISISFCSQDLELNLILNKLVQNYEPFNPKAETLSTFSKTFWTNIYKTLKPFVPETKHSKDSDNKYFLFVPLYIGSILPGGQTLKWSASCFKQSSAFASKITGNNITISFTTQQSTSLICEDFYIFTTMSGLQLHLFKSKGTENINWSVENLSNNEIQDIQQNGIRIFRFLGSPTFVIEAIIATAELFIPALTGDSHVPPQTAAANVEFLKEYPQIVMAPRNITTVELDESMINSGDFFGVIRLDGLDPMLAWGMGAHTGHTTVALWIDDQLNICESTTASNYWPTDGLQCTPYRTWLQQAADADHNVVHVPLAKKYVDMFDEQKAVEWFKSVEGMPYGYHNMLFAWIDTVYGNLPCIPPDYTLCLDPEVLHTLSGIVDKFDPAISYSMWNQAMGKRLGMDDVKGISTVDLVSTAANKGFNFSEFIMLPEQDAWVYDDGYSYVCDVFVCEMYKSAGLFGNLTDQIQCTEFTNWDVYVLTFFDRSTQRPIQCVEADPNSDLCQILGDYSLTLPDWATRDPYPHMAENCPALPPNYIRPTNC